MPLKKVFVHYKYRIFREMNYICFKRNKFQNSNMKEIAVKEIKKQREKTVVSPKIILKDGNANVRK